MSAIAPLNDILIPLLAVGLAEMGDKTQLSVLLLSPRNREYAQLLAGIILAFLLADGFAIMVLIGVMTALLILSAMAIYLGKLLSSRIDRRQVSRVAGVAFLLIGLSFMLSAVMSSAFADMF